MLRFETDSLIYCSLLSEQTWECMASLEELLQASLIISCYSIIHIDPISSLVHNNLTLQSRRQDTRCSIAVKCLPRLQSHQQHEHTYWSFDDKLSRCIDKKYKSSPIRKWYLYSQINQIATDAVMHRHKLTDQAAKDTNANTRHLDLTDISQFNFSKHFFFVCSGQVSRWCIEKRRPFLKGMQSKRKKRIEEMDI